MRRVSIARFVGVTLALLLAVSGGYLLVANWQLQRWLRSHAAALGCGLDYASATTLMPGHFRLEALRLSGCNHGAWSARVAKAEGAVEFRSWVWGPARPRHVELALDAVRVGRVALDGQLQIVIDARTGAVHAQVRANELNVRRGGRPLAKCRHARLDVELPVATGLAYGSASFVLHSFASPPLALVAEGEVTGSLQMKWDAHVPRLKLEEGNVPTVPLSIGAESVQAALQVSQLSVSPAGASGGGRLLLQGQDAHLLLQALRAPESLRFALSGLENAPFTFSSNVGFASGKWKFDDIELTADQASATGAVSIEGTNRAGTLHVVYRGLAMGVQFSNEQSNVIFDPPDGWPGSGT